MQKEHSQLRQSSSNWSLSGLQRHPDCFCTVNLQFQGQFVSTSLRQILELWQLILWVQSGHHIVNFFHLVGISVSTR